jgi:preprotein translocase subunit SecG
MEKEECVVRKSVSDDGNSKRLRRRKMLHPSKQQNKGDNGHGVKQQPQCEKDRLENVFRRNVSILVLLLFISIIGLVYFRPKLLFPHDKQRLPTRTITTVYPRDMKISKALPTAYAKLSLRASFLCAGHWNE